MKGIALLGLTTLTLLASALPSQAMEPIVLSSAQPAEDHDVAAEQAHLQTFSAQMRQGVARREGLPHTLKAAEAPKAPQLLNLSF
jgi:outer membrane lipoprotein-sorting protein